MSYTITKTNGSIDWETVPVLQIDKVLWRDDTGIRAKGQICHNDMYMFVHLSAVEKYIRAENTEPLSPVYEDSCLEFFFMSEKDNGYFNFEINPNGCLIVQYGLAGPDRKDILVDDMASFYDIHTNRTPDGWEVFYSIPLDLLRSYVPDFRFSGKLFANMYKCGNKTVNKHFLSWSPVDLELPNFHCPEFFGTMIFDPGCAP